MKKIFAYMTAVCLLAGLSFIGQAQAETQAEPNKGQIVIKSGSKASAYAKAENFTGKARVDDGFRTEAPQRTYGSYVSFEPGARTHWHIHPMGQVLLVTYGTGMTQEWGKKIQIIKAGDIVVCPPNVKHWHGAAPDTPMTHFAIGERIEGKSVTWLEEVSEEQYNGTK